ncbi:MAG: hypothetical protein EA360_07795 [Balneolaceae bacterium]|nr:MAG: hypothetical protein EA360_07795 [Balneolaceae bacterium]
MGKKIALGCLGLFLIALAAGGYFGYQFIKPFMGGFTSLEEISEANSRISNQSDFARPASGELTGDQVSRFVTVQEDILAGLESRFTDFQDKYEEIGSKWENRDPSFREMANVWGDLFDLFRDAKQIQVDALNRQGFSLSEYRFVQTSFYQALGVELFAFNIDQIAEAAREGLFDLNMDEFEEMRSEMDQIPEVNRRLAAPYADSSERWLPFAWIGL